MPRGHARLPPKYIPPTTYLLLQSAVLCVQRNVKGYIQRKKYTRMKQEKAAVIIQKHHRGRSARVK
eukprot:scaffold681888_cov59-Prasinocladus_malaysianus.AAC.1